MCHFLPPFKIRSQKYDSPMRPLTLLLFFIVAFSEKYERYHNFQFKQFDVTKFGIFL